MTLDLAPVLQMLTYSSFFLNGFHFDCLITLASIIILDYYYMQHCQLLLTENKMKEMLDKKK